SPTRSAQRFLPRGCSQGWLFRLQPGGSFGERKFVGTRFEKTRAPEIEKRIVRLLERNLRDRARKIKLPIKRRPVQSGVGERNGFFEIVFLIRNDSQPFGAADSDRTRKHFLSASGAEPRNANNDQNQSGQPKQDRYPAKRPTRERTVDRQSQQKYRGKHCADPMTRNVNKTVQGKQNGGDERGEP